MSQFTLSNTTNRLLGLETGLDTDKVVTLSVYTVKQSVMLVLGLACWFTPLNN